MAQEQVTVAMLASMLDARIAGDPSVGVDSVTHDSRAVRPGALFCCVPGLRVDGHDFAANAVAAGATSLLCERELDVDAAQLIVADVRAAMARAAAEVAGRPSDRLSIVGVTGTNGKTTVVSILGSILAHAGREVRVIGTLTGARTTPEATDLQSDLARYVEEGVTDVAMEVSSHALALHRVDAIHFGVAVFTNLGRDHLDFHGTDEAYFAAKAKLFEPGRASTALVNVDDVHGRLLLDVAGGSSDGPTVRGYSLDDLDRVVCRPDGSSFRWRGRDTDIALPGRHNVSNALAAAEASIDVGVDVDVIVEALGRLPVVPGRFEAVRVGQPFSVVVDYAHTPDALESVLRAAGDLAPGGARVTVVFGCGGDRDALKRPEMGAVACATADRVIVTNDNPRSEDPLRIIDEIRTGCADAPEIEPDRRVAIRLAVRGAEAGDVVVIAGKGHEQGQVFADRTDPFDDREVVRDELAALGFTDAGDVGTGAGAP